MSDIIGFIFGLSFLIIIIWVLIAYLKNLAKLVDQLRDEDLTSTHIHKAWVWTQLIPAWSFVAQIVLNIKLESAARTFENKHGLSNKTILYPTILGWIIALGFLYSWIPGLGSLFFFVCIIMYWVKVSSTIKQIIDIKSSNNTTM